MLIHGNSRAIALEDKSIHCVITSPPYFSKRDYNLEPQIWGGAGDCVHEWGKERIVIQGEGGGFVKNWHTGGVKDFDSGPKSQGQFCAHCHAWRGSLGLEPTIELYIGHLVEVFREVWRVLRDDGTCWINIGDSYAGSTPGTTKMNPVTWSENGKIKKAGMTRVGPVEGLKPKDLCLVPDHLRIALQKDGWYVRSKIIWHKPNPMPESATDRPAVDFEDVIMLSKKPRYFWDMEAVKERVTDEEYRTKGKVRPNPDKVLENPGFEIRGGLHNQKGGRPTRNLRTVWAIPTQGYGGAHFATFPTRLVEPMVKAGTSQRGVCGDCGAPWVREVEKTASPHTGKSQTAYQKGSTANRLAMARQAARENGKEYTSHTRTLGWSPTCNCYRTRNPEKRRRQDLTGSWLARIWFCAAPTRPAIVLDPFCGSGTVGEVCRTLDRRFIGLDLSPEYLGRNAKPRAEKGTCQAALEELPLFEGLK